MASALLGVDRHTAIVAHVLGGAAGEVEERRLAAVGVANESHVDGAALFGGQVLKACVKSFNLNNFTAI